MVAAAIMAAGLLLTAAVWWPVGGQDERRRHLGRGQAENGKPPALGVYRGARNLTGVADFERWLGRDVGVHLDFLPGGSWEEIEGSSWQLRHWSASDATLVLTVPMLPGPWDRSYDGGVSLRDCSAGAYDRHWTRLAGNLVAHRLGGSILRIGHEFNADWYAWRAAGEEAEYAGCFRRVVRAMRKVRGSAFAFDWNPALGRLDADPLLAYPGDSYVDTIGIDVYDQSWAPATYPIPAGASTQDVRGRRQRTWSRILHGDQGLEFWSRFARSHGKRLSIPEWGLTRRDDGHGGGDNPYFVEQMHRFISDRGNGVAYFIYFDHDAPDGEHRLTGGRFGRAARAFRASFGAIR
jgi:glycosyl hydrolase family 26